MLLLRVAAAADDELLLLLLLHLPKAIGNIIAIAEIVQGYGAIPGW